MAEPNNDAAGSVMNAATSAAKWGLIGAVAAIVLPIALGAGTVAATLAVGSAVGGVGGVIAGGLTALVGGMLTLGATAAWWTFGVAGFAAGGGLLGVFKSGQHANAISQARQARMDRINNPRSHQRTKELNDTAIQNYAEGMSAGVKVGEQRGAAMVVQEIQNRELQMAQVVQKDSAPAIPGAAGATALAAASAEAKCDCGPHTKAVIQREQAAAAAVGTNVPQP